MKTKLILLSISILVSISISSQDFCFTPSSTSNLEFNNSSQLRATNETYYYVLRIYFHVIRKSDGTGGQSTKSVSDAYRILNNDFNPHRIFFRWGGTIDYIDDSSQYNAPNPSIYSVNNHQDGVDIYLYDNSSKAGGRANGVGESSEFWVSGNYWNSPFQSLITSHIISHEMGHVLFLWHTHHGTFNEGGNDNPCAELVNGSNSATCGDYVIDTPADPHLHFDINQLTCKWNGSTRDANGDLYKPDANLIMSYTDVGCMRYFSLKQGERMRNAIETLPFLQRVLVSKFTSPRISGTLTPCVQAEYKIENLPASATVQWSASNNVLKLTSGQGTAKAVFKQTGFGKSEIRATVSMSGTVVTTLKLAVTTCEPNPSISGTTSPCTQAEYKVENLPAGATIQWSSTDNTLKLVSGQGTAKALFKQLGFGSCTISADVMMNGASVKKLSLYVYTCRPELSEGELICSRGYFSLKNLPAGATIQWSSTDKRLQLASGQGTPKAEFRHVGNDNFSAKIRATVTIKGGASTQREQAVYAGVPQDIQMLPNEEYFDGYFMENPNQIVRCPVKLIHAQGWLMNDKENIFIPGHELINLKPCWEIVKLTDNFDYEIRGPLEIEEAYGNVLPVHDMISIISKPSPIMPHYGMFMVIKEKSLSVNVKEISFKIRFRNACGWSEYKTYNLKRLPDTWLWSIYHNPSTDMVSVHLQPANAPRDSAPKTSPYEIQLWSSTALIRTFKTNQPEYQFSVSDLPAGIYFARAIAEGKAYTKKLIKK